MANPQWLEEKTNWILANKFLFPAAVNGEPPKIGDRKGKFTIVGAWVNKRGYLKAYKVLCDCGNSVEYIKVNNIKNGHSTQCTTCKINEQSSESTKYFRAHYCQKDSKVLSVLYQRKSKDVRKFKNGPTFYEEWLIDYKAFAEYWITLPQWTEFRDQIVSFGHPDHLTPDRIDTSRGYVPGNIRFVTMKQQARNKTNTLFMLFQNEIISLMDFIELLLGPEYKDTKAANFIRSRYHESRSAEQIIELLYADSEIWDHKPVMINFFSWYFSRSK